MDHPDLPSSAGDTALLPPPPAPASASAPLTSTPGRANSANLKVSTTCKDSDDPSSATTGGGVRKDREEWSEAAISTLIDAYTSKYGQLNGKGLRSKDWAEVVETVNANQRSAKTVEHCRNKMDTLTKRYKSEKKNKISGVESTWPWYDRMEVIRGCSPAKSLVASSAPSPAAATNTTTTTTTTTNSSKPTLLPPVGSVKEKVAGGSRGSNKRGKKLQQQQQLQHGLEDLSLAAEQQQQQLQQQQQQQQQQTTKGEVNTNINSSYSSGKLTPGATTVATTTTKGDVHGGGVYRPEVMFGRMDALAAAHHHMQPIPAAWHSSSPSTVAATVAAAAHSAMPQVAAASAAARVACEQVTGNNGGECGEGGSLLLARSIGELAASLKVATGNLASSINGFTEVYARVEIAKMEMLKELELKRMQMQMDTADLLRSGGGSKRKRENSSEDGE